MYDGLGQLIQTQTLQAQVLEGTQEVLRDLISDTSYNAVGQPVRASVSYAVTPGSGYRAPDLSQPAGLTSYDTLGRTRVVTGTDGTTTQYGYAMLNSTLTNARGHTTTSVNDVWGRTVNVIPPTGPGVTYSYDIGDKLLSAVRGGATTSLTYDLAGRKLAMNDADMGYWQYSYRCNGKSRL